MPDREPTVRRCLSALAVLVLCGCAGAGPPAADVQAQRPTSTEISPTTQPPTSSAEPTTTTTRPPPTPEPCILTVDENGTQFRGGGGGASLSSEFGGASRIGCSGGPTMIFEDESDALVVDIGDGPVRIAEGETVMVGPYDVRVTVAAADRLVAEIVLARG